MADLKALNFITHFFLAFPTRSRGAIWWCFRDCEKTPKEAYFHRTVTGLSRQMAGNSLICLDYFKSNLPWSNITTKTSPLSSRMSRVPLWLKTHQSKWNRFFIKALRLSAGRRRMKSIEKGNFQSRGPETWNFIVKIAVLTTITP